MTLILQHYILQTVLFLWKLVSISISHNFIPGHWKKQSSLLRVQVVKNMKDRASPDGRNGMKYGEGCTSSTPKWSLKVAFFVVFLTIQEICQPLMARNQTSKETVKVIEEGRGGSQSPKLAVNSHPVTPTSKCRPPKDARDVIVDLLYFCCSIIHFIQQACTHLCFEVEVGTEYTNHSLLTNCPSVFLTPSEI